MPKHLTGIETAASLPDPSLYDEGYPFQVGGELFVIDGGAWTPVGAAALPMPPHTDLGFTQANLVKQRMAGLRFVTDSFAHDDPRLDSPQVHAAAIVFLGQDLDNGEVEYYDLDVAVDSTLTIKWSLTEYGGGTPSAAIDVDGTPVVTRGSAFVEETIAVAVPAGTETITIRGASASGASWLKVRRMWLSPDTEPTELVGKLVRDRDGRVLRYLGDGEYGVTGADSAFTPSGKGAIGGDYTLAIGRRAVVSPSPDLYNGYDSYGLAVGDGAWSSASDSCAVGADALAPFPEQTVLGVAAVAGASAGDTVLGTYAASGNLYGGTPLGFLPAGPTATPAGGGSLPAGVYRYSVAPYDADGVSRGWPVEVEVSAGSSTVGLSWSAVAGADGYLIFGRRGNDTSLLPIGDVAGTSFNDDGTVEPGTLEPWGALHLPRVDSSGQVGYGERTVIGYSAGADGEYATAVGTGSSADGQGATALGGYTSAAHARSVALGQDATTTRDNQIAMGTPSEFVDMLGGMAVRVRSVSATTTVDTGGNKDHVILVTASAAVTVNLPAASTMTGRVLVVKKIDASANNVTIDPNASETIDGATTRVLSTQWASVRFVSNGTSWFTI